MMLKGVQVNRPPTDPIHPTPPAPKGPPGPVCDAAELRALNAGYVRIHCSFPGTNFASSLYSPTYVASITAPKPPAGSGAGVKAIPYAEPGSATATDPDLWVKWVDAWIAAYGPYCDTFEWINEPNFKEGLGTGDNQKFDRCLSLYRTVLPRFRTAGKKLLLSAAGQQQTDAFLTRADNDTQTPPGGSYTSGSTTVPYGPGLTGPMFTGANPVAKDGVCIHSYAADVSTGAPSVLSKFNAARWANPPTNTVLRIPLSIPIWMTEVGWGTYPPDVHPVPPGNVWVKTPAGQASRVDALFDVMRTKESEGLAGVCYFIWKDYDDGAAKPHAWAGPYGLRYGSANSLTVPYGITPDSKKPSWQMFANWPASWGVTTATAPTVTTTFGVTNLTQTSATVSGTVDPNQLPTTRWFDWGLTTGYGSSSPSVSVGSGDVAVNVSYTIQGLTPGETYHYQCRAQNSAGVSTGADRTFTTNSPPLAPTVTTGSATNVTVAGATLNGIVDPNAVSTAAYFEYGPTTSYGSRAPATDIAVGSGSQPVPVSAQLTGLTIGATVHYRLRALNAQGLTLGSDQSFTVTPPAVDDPTAPPVLPSLALSVEISTADGRTYRWDPDATDPRDRPYEMQFATAAGDGFAEGSCVVYRPIGLDWPDLALLTKGKFIGVDGQTTYEGRVAGMPRSVDDTGEKIQVSFAGPMSSARDRPFMEVYVERGTENWQEASLALRLAYANAQIPLDADYVPQVDVGSLSFKGASKKTIPLGSAGILEWQAPSGCKAAVFQYRADDKGTSINPRCDAETLFADDADDQEVLVANWDNYAMTNDNTPQSITLTTPRKFLALRLRAKEEHTLTTESTAHRIFHQVCVYGDHGVALRDNGPDPDGVYASDVMADIIDRFCPLLDSSEITPTEHVIEQLVFDTPTMPFDAFTLLNGYHLYLLGAYEGGKVMFKPADLTKADWEIRSDDLGVSLDLHGDTTDQFGNGMVVSYPDVETRNQVLWPPDWEELQDTDPDNPANIAGIELWAMLELSNPVTRNGALRLGEVALAEFNRPKSPGTVTVASGYVPDSNGNLQPAHKVRYGQTLSIIDLPNESPRLITATSWNEDGSLQITLEQPPTRVDAVLARLSLSQRTAGIG